MSKSYLNYLVYFRDRNNRTVCFDYFTNLRAVDNYCIDVYTYHIRSTLDNEYIKNVRHVKKFLKKLLKFVKNLSAVVNVHSFDLPPYYCMMFLAGLKCNNERFNILNIKNSIFDICCYIRPIEKGNHIFYTLGKFYKVSDSGDKSELFDADGIGISDERVEIFPQKKFRYGVNIKGAC